jgi:hypothetical protein
MTWSNATSSRVQLFHPLRLPLARLPLLARSFLGHYPSLSTPPLPVTQRGIEDSPGHWAGSLRFTHCKRLRVALLWVHYIPLWIQYPPPVPPPLPLSESHFLGLSIGLYSRKQIPCGRPSSSIPVTISL